MAGHSRIDWFQLARGLCRFCPLLKGCSVIKRFPLSVRHPSALMMVSRRGGAERDGPVRVTSFLSLCSLRLSPQKPCNHPTGVTYWMCH